jgi:hypothetical protein
LDSITNWPVLIYDDRCSSCTIFAKYAFKYSRGQINCIGHYSKEGEKLRKIVFPPNYNETEMFWIVTNSHAYGGRSGLLPLLVLIIKGFFNMVIKGKMSPNLNIPQQCFDNQTCNDNKFKLKRLFKMLRSGKKLKTKFISPVNE